MRRGNRHILYSMLVGKYVVSDTSLIYISRGPEFERN